MKEETLPREEDTPLPQPADSDRRPWNNADRGALFVLVLVTTILRFMTLAHPDDMIFDEVYYAKDSCFYVLNSEDPCQVDGHQAEVHPPVGKWLIGAGIKIFGFDSFGWRVGPAVAGVLSVVLLFLIARRLFGNWIWASLAAGLLAIDPLHLVQSRTSMLDIFLPLFGLATVYFLLLDKDRIETPRDDGTPRRLLRGRPWRMAAGVAAGLAVSTKWTGGFFLALAIFLTLAWESGARPGPRVSRLFGAIRSEWASIVAWLIALPVVIYVLSYAGQIQGNILAAPWSAGSWGRALWDHHKYMWNFHTTLEATHGYQSPPWSWMLIKRPVSYYFCSGANCDPPTPEGDYSEIFATGSPLVWWASILAILGVAIVWLWRRDQRDPAGLILAGIAFIYGPWLLPGASRSAVFIFYLLPAVPFMILALVYWMHRISDSWEGKAATAIFTAGSLAMFWFYLPLLTGRSLPQPDWQKRIWKFDDCDKPVGELVTTTVTVTENGETRETTSETRDNSSLPPNGWCWI